MKTSIKLQFCSQGDKSPHQCLEEFKNTIKQAEGHGMKLGNETKVRKHCAEHNSDTDDSSEATTLECGLEK